MQLMIPNDHEKREWARLAQAAYSAGRNDLGHKFSGWAALRRGEGLPIPTFDALQAIYREWLISGSFMPRPTEPTGAPDGDRAGHEYPFWLNAR